MLPEQPDIRSYGIRISEPDGENPVEVVDVRGTFQLIPPEYQLRTLRYFPRQNGFIPHGAVAIDRVTKTWSVSGFDIGGQPDEERGIEIALAGPTAKILLDYWLEANQVHSEVQKTLRDLTGKYGPWLPAIVNWPNDLVTCQRIYVKRKRPSL
jgi:hypothetical protein